VISFLVLTYDLRTLSEPVELPKSREESPGNRMQNDLSDGATTGRDARDVGSASFTDNVYPVQVDLTEWTRKFEQKFEDFAKLVDLRFNALDSHIKGLEEKFDAIDRRQNETEKLTSTRFEEVKERFNQFESRLNDSKTETVMSTPSGNCVKMRAAATLDSNKRYKEFNGKCYLFNPSPAFKPGLSGSVRGETARTYCQGLGADMVAVETSAENEFIKRVVDVEESDMPNGDDVWVLGAKRSGIGQPFFWVQTGNTVEAGFNDWEPRHPDEYSQYQTVYVYMEPRWLDSDRKRKWGAYPNGSSDNIICEA